MAEEKASYDLSKYPKVLKTKEDYEFIRINFPYDVYVNDFRELLMNATEEKFVGWCKIKKNNKGEEPIITKFHRWTKSPTDKNLKRNMKKIIWKNDEEYDLLCTSEIDPNTNEELPYELEVRNYIKPVDGTPLRYWVFTHVLMQNSKLEQLGYTVQEVSNICMGIDPTFDITKYTKALDEQSAKLQKKIDELNVEIKKDEEKLNGRKED